MSEPCRNENRIVKLETRLDRKQDEIQELKDELSHDREELREMLVCLTQLNTTLNTLKWIIVLFVSIFGGLNAFLFQEFIKLI